MPKTDTLDALDNAMTTILTTNKLWTYSEETLKKLWRNSDETLKKLWRYAQDLTKSQKHESLTHSPTWIQEMLAHLKKPTCWALVTTDYYERQNPWPSWCLTLFSCNALYIDDIVNVNWSNSWLIMDVQPRLLNLLSASQSLKGEGEGQRM